MSNVSKPIPERCKKCPVLARANNEIAEYKKWEQRWAKNVMKYLDRDAEDPDAVESAIARAAGGLAMNNFMRLAVLHEKRGLLVSRIGEGCLGVTRDPHEVMLEKVIHMLTGQGKICRNTEFRELVGDPTITSYLGGDVWWPDGADPTWDD